MGSRLSIETRLESRSPALDGSMSPQRFCDYLAVEALPASKVAECVARSISLAVGVVLPYMLTFDDVSFVRFVEYRR